MSKPPSKTVTLDDGLRYKSKVSGSPFASPPFSSKTTMSCFLCGKHRPRTDLMSRKLLGKTHVVCSPKCA